MWVGFVGFRGMRSLSCAFHGPGDNHNHMHTHMQRNLFRPHHTSTSTYTPTLNTHSRIRTGVELIQHAVEGAVVRELELAEELLGLDVVDAGVLGAPAFLCLCGWNVCGWVGLVNE